MGNLLSRAVGNFCGAPMPLEAEAGGGGGGGRGGRDDEYTLPIVDLTTTPPLLDLLKRFPDLFVKEVLDRLDPTTRALFGQAGSACRAAVVDSGLAFPGKDLSLPFERVTVGTGEFGVYLVGISNILTTWYPELR
jgi:hypothetical protein